MTDPTAAAREYSRTRYSNAEWAEVETHFLAGWAQAVAAAVREAVGAVELPPDGMRYPLDWLHEAIAARIAALAPPAPEAQ